MPKRALNALTLLSAVVCVGSLMLVARSFVRTDRVTVPIGNTAACATFVADGHFGLSCGRASRRFSYQSSPVSHWRPAYQVTWRGVSGIRWLGIGWGTSPRGVLLILPLWLLPLLTAIPPVRWWRNRRRERGRGFAVEAAAR